MFRHPGTVLGEDREISASPPAAWRPLLCYLLFLPLALCATPSSPAGGSDGKTVAVLGGFVHNGEAPIAGATVRIQTSNVYTKTDSLGFFRLEAEDQHRAVVLTASAPGYYIGGGQEHRPGDQSIEIVLAQHATKDHREYAWVSAFANAGDKSNCQNCHADRSGADSPLPFDQWRRDAHAGSARNPRFLTMYLGTDVDGNRSPPTRFRTDRDYGQVPIRPTDDERNFGPGYRLDFPTTNGNCAACHAPMAALDDPYGTDPAEIAGVAEEGVGCDFCHKISDVMLDPATGLPFDNRPGVMSYEFRRPAPGHQYFAGPFDDVAPGEDVYSPLQTESRYCAPCHSARFWGTEIYNSYGEWLASPYARPGAVTTCQDCHMPPGLTDHFARVEKGGKRRDPDTISGHLMPGAGDAGLLGNAVTMTVGTELRDSTLVVRVEILNDRTGHHVPTDSPLRQMILVVLPTDERGAALDQIDGPILPTWCGLGDSDRGYISSLPGTAYAKVLEELWTGVSPTGAYWNQTRIRSDNRIAAMDSDETTYLFEPPPQGKVTVDVRLLYRRTFIELRDLKGWDDEDIEMARQTMILDRTDGSSVHAMQSAVKGREQ